MAGSSRARSVFHEILPIRSQHYPVPRMRSLRSEKTSGRIQPMDLPEPVIFLAIEPKTKADRDKLSQGLQMLMAEEPTFRVNTDTRTGQTIIRGMSELQLEVIVRNELYDGSFHDIDSSEMAFRTLGRWRSRMPRRRPSRYCSNPS